MTTLYQSALGELEAVFARIDQNSVDSAVDLIAGARRIALHGVGREGLQMKGFAMRLFHLGKDTSVVGEMTCPSVEAGDLLIVSAGPGHFSTVSALLDVARHAGAATLVVTAQPGGECAARASNILHVPAQTMADDQAANGSVLPMGSLYEGALYILFEVMVLKLRDKLGITAEAMRHRHTNLE